MSDMVSGDGRVLTRAIAEEIRQNPRSIDCNEFTSLEKGAAKILAKYVSWLVLNGLTALSDSQAGALAKSEGGLSLNGLTALTDVQAESLAKHKNSLYLNGLAALSDSQAEALAKHEGWLSLNGLSALSDSQAGALAKSEGGLSLDGLAALTDLQAEALAKHKGQLSLDGLSALSDSQAEALANNKYSLFLNGLAALSDSQAEALAKHKDSLYLNGLAALSDSQAEALAKHKDDLYLNGLAALSDSQAEALAKHKNSLYLDGLAALTDAQAEALAKHKGWLSLNGLAALSDSQAEALTKHEGDLWLNGLTSWESRALAKKLFDENDSNVPDEVVRISATVAAGLAEHDGELQLDGLAVIGLDVAEALSMHKGPLSLNKVSRIGVDVGRALAKHRGTLGLLGLTELPDEVADELCVLPAGAVIACPEVQQRLADRRSRWLTWLNELPSLTDVALHQLSRFRGDLPVNGLETLSDREAKLLVNRGDWLSLNGLTSLSDAVALVLAEHSGRLVLDGVTTLSDHAAATLATHVGDLNTSRWPKSAAHVYQSTREAVSIALRYAADPATVDLSQVKDLSVEQSRVLARTGWYLNLSGLTSLDDEAASLLACHTGSLNLMSLRDLSEKGGQSLGCHLGPVYLALDQLPTRVAAAFEGARRANAFYPGGAITNSLGMVFALIPSGEFRMGTPGDNGEEYPHRVRITRPYYLGVHLVTQAQYERVMGNNPSFFRGPDLPVEHVAWDDAKVFCEALSRIPEERQAGRAYRLPTEAEWEYACRAGTNTTYSFGDECEQGDARFSQEQAWAPQQTVPVGSYAPNAWGLFDMHGNVWEWTQDWFSGDYYKQSPVDDPRGPDAGTHHTLRGGSASVTEHECRSAMRGEAATADGPSAEARGRYEKVGDFGLRVVCETTNAPLMAT